MSEMNRREFVAAAAAACVVCVCHGGAALAAAGEPVDAGPVGDFAKDGIYDKLAASGVVIVRMGERIYALSSICTHKGGVVKAEGQELRCPKHSARFSLTGAVLKEPARRPLARLAIKLDGRKHIIVDPAKRFEEKDWNDPAASVTV